MIAAATEAPCSRVYENRAIRTLRVHVASVRDLSLVVIHPLCPPPFPSYFEPGFPLPPPPFFSSVSPQFFLSSPPLSLTFIFFLSPWFVMHCVSSSSPPPPLSLSLFHSHSAPPPLTPMCIKFLCLRLMLRVEVCVSIEPS